MKRIKLLFAVALLLAACSDNTGKPESQFDLCSLPPGKIMERDREFNFFGSDNYKIIIVDKDGIVSTVEVPESVYSLASDVASLQAAKDSCKGK